MSRGTLIQDKPLLQRALTLDKLDTLAKAKQRIQPTQATTSHHRQHGLLIKQHSSLSLRGIQNENAIVRDFSITNAKYCQEGGDSREGGTSNLQQIASRLSGKIDLELSPSKKKLSEL